MRTSCMRAPVSEQPPAPPERPPLGFPSPGGPAASGLHLSARRWHAGSARPLSVCTAYPCLMPARMQCRSTGQVPSQSARKACSRQPNYPAAARAHMQTAWNPYCAATPSLVKASQPVEVSSPDHKMHCDTSLQLPSKTLGVACCAGALSMPLCAGRNAACGAVTVAAGPAAGPPSPQAAPGPVETLGQPCSCQLRWYAQGPAPTSSAFTLS